MVQMTDSSDVLRSLDSYITSTSTSTSASSVYGSVYGMGYGNIFSLHPNPATETITITLKEALNNGELKIFALKGTLVLEQKIEQNSFTVNVSALEKGVYFVHILDNGASIDEQKLIIQ